MAKKRKKWVLVGVGLLVGAVAVVLYLDMGENWRYVKAAKGIEKARTDAEAAFGPLTWQEYSAQEGIEYHDDREAWQALKESIPHDVDLFFGNERVLIPTRAEVYLKEQAWFDALPQRIDGLSAQVGFDPNVDDWSRTFDDTMKSLARAVQVAVIGAADLGDPDAMRKHARTLIRLIEKVEEEPLGNPIHTGVVLRSLLIKALGHAAIKNRGQAEIVETAKSLLDEVPPLPRPVDWLAASCRNVNVYVQQMQELSPEEIDEWLESDLGYFRYPGQFPTPSRARKGPAGWIRGLYDSLVRRSNRDERRVGEHTADALEARYLEVAVEQARLVGDGESIGWREAYAVKDLLDELPSRVALGNDPSYEFAAIMTNTRFDYAFLRQMFLLKATRAAIELSVGYPTIDSLPDALPQDLLFKNELGRGTDCLYRKTDTGFVLYSALRDGTDNGFVVDTSTSDQYVSILWWATKHTDWGIGFNYSPIPSP